MKLARINNLLLAAIIVVNGYIIAAPFLTQLHSRWEMRPSNRAQLQKIVDSPGLQPSSKDGPEQLIIPALGLNDSIGEGTYANRYGVLHNGIWRDSLGSQPPLGGNTVLAGHRFTYTNPHGVFYSLDKLKIGDQIAILWYDQEYRYQVSEIKIVPPTATDIQKPTEEPQLTLFTCTPLFHPTSRLVVIAKEIKS